MESTTSTGRADWDSCLLRRFWPDNLLLFFLRSNGSTGGTNSIRIWHFWCYSNNNFFHYTYLGRLEYTLSLKYFSAYYQIPPIRKIRLCVRCRVPYFTYLHLTKFVTSNLEPGGGIQLHYYIATTDVQHMGTCSHNFPQSGLLLIRCRICLQIGLGTHF